MATCSVSTLLTSGKDFQALSKRELQICICQLLCNISNGSQILSGSGAPENSVTAPVGTIYSNLAGGVFVHQYVKVSGSGNTGWTLTI